MSTSIRSDTAVALTKAIVEKFTWDREEQRAEAFRELLPVVTAGLYSLIELSRRERKRLAKPPIEEDEQCPDPEKS